MINNDARVNRIQRWIYCGGGGRGGGGEGESVIFHYKSKNIRDKIRYSNLSNDMMIQQLQCEQ